MNYTGNVLRIKVFRDIKAQKGMFLAVTFILFLGVMLFYSFYLAYLNLNDTYKHFYEETNFEDISIEVGSVPEEILSEIRKIDGVEKVEGRISLSGIALINNNRIPVRIISVPEEQPEINSLYIADGSYPAGTSVLILKKFADYHNLNVGSTIHLEFGGKKAALRISGLVYSPEYIIIVEEGELITSPGSYGIVFVPEKFLAAMGYSINEIKIKVTDDDRKEEVLYRALHILKPHEVHYYYISDSQPSKKLLEEDLEGFRSLAVLFPSFFILISIFATYILLARMTREQIGNIAVLRAMGLKKGEILTHYLTYPLLIGFSATLSGMVFGYLSAGILTSNYISYLNLPYYISKPHYDVLTYSSVAGIMAPVISGFIVARNAAEINIVQALRGYTEELYRSGVLDRIVDTLTQKILKTRLIVRFAVRNVFRNRKRTAFSAFSVIASLSLILNSMVFLDSMDYAMDMQFGKILAYDIKVKFEGYADEEALKEIRFVKGVIEAYPVIETPVLIEKGGITKAIMLVATENQNLYNIFDAKGNRLLPPPEGILLPSLIAKNLSVVGDERVLIYTEFGEGKVRVYDIAKMPLMPVSYTSLSYIRQVTGIDGFNVAVVRVEDGKLEEVKEKLEKIDGVAKVETVEKAREDIMELMDFFYAFIFFSLLFGASLGFAAVFNTTNINVLERRRELATLRMLGYTTKELGLSLLVENIIIGLIGLIVGLPLAYLSAYGFYTSLQSELYYLPMVIYPRTYAVTVILIFAVLILTLIPGIRFIGKMEISKVTKEVVS
jgi:putative ABC transport system permease protein